MKRIAQTKPPMLALLTSCKKSSSGDYNSSRSWLTRLLFNIGCNGANSWLIVFEPTPLAVIVAVIVFHWHNSSVLWMQSLIRMARLEHWLHQMSLKRGRFVDLWPRKANMRKRASRFSLAHPIPLISKSFSEKILPCPLRPSNDPGASHKDDPLPPQSATSLQLDSKSSHSLRYHVTIDTSK